MYVKRIQLINYGPIDRLDISFPFDGDSPKPVVLVGENGSGKSILLSHIVNGLLLAKDNAFPHAREVREGQVYKLRSNSYIRVNREHYLARVDFENNIFVEEIRLVGPKRTVQSRIESQMGSDFKKLWGKLDPEENEKFNTNLRQNQEILEKTFSNRCVLYFPPNRFEEPAWLNESNLTARARFMESKTLQGDTNRKVINYSPLLDNQNWLFEAIFDSRAFERQESYETLQLEGEPRPTRFPVFSGHHGEATRSVEMALSLMARVLKMNRNLRLTIGRRGNRVVGISEHDDLTFGENLIVPNIFQLSTGETSLLNLFISILRDYDLSGAEFSIMRDIRGVVIVDEIDLHLHAVHQYEILPELMRMFMVGPNVWTTKLKK